MDPFADRLAAAVRARRTPVLVGLDPRGANLPALLRPAGSHPSPADWAQSYRQFCREVIDVVAPLVPAVKPQAAFFEQLGAAGMLALADTIQYAAERDLLVILDGKRNDIGSTATAYADGYLGSRGQSVWGADALTVSPYLGDDSLTPFVDVAQARGAGLFILVKTSNPGGRLFQDLECQGSKLFERVGAYVEQLAGETLGACGYGSVGAVVGATHPEQLAALRDTMPRSWFLVPGFGAQGGTARDAAGAFDAHGLGAIVNSSRAIIFAHQREPYREKFGEQNWQGAVEAATREMIDQLRTETPAGRLFDKNAS